MEDGVKTHEQELDELLANLLTPSMEGKVFTSTEVNNVLTEFTARLIAQFLDKIERQEENTNGID